MSQHIELFYCPTRKPGCSGPLADLGHNGNNARCPHCIETRDLAIELFRLNMVTQACRGGVAGTSIYGCSGPTSHAPCERCKRISAMRDFLASVKCVSMNSACAGADPVSVLLPQYRCRACATLRSHLQGTLISSGCIDGLGPCRGPNKATLNYMCNLCGWLALLRARRFYLRGQPTARTIPGPMTPVTPSSEAYLGVVLGLRAWTWRPGETFLRGAYDGRWYSARLHARCKGPKHSLLHHGDDGPPPHPGGRCGINLYMLSNSRLDSMTHSAEYNVIGLTQGWGRIIEHRDGYRVQDALVTHVLITNIWGGVRGIVYSPGLPAGWQKRGVQVVNDVGHFKDLMAKAGEANQLIAVDPSELL